MQTTWRSLCGQLLRTTPQTNTMITTLQSKNVMLTDLVADGIDMRDYPDFADAFITSAYVDGREATEDELDAINEQSELVYETVLSQLY